MVMVHLMGRMGTEPIPPIKRSVSIDTMINFDGEGDGDGTCKQALNTRSQTLQTLRPLFFYVLIIQYFREKDIEV